MMDTTTGMKPEEGISATTSSDQTLSGKKKTTITAIKRPHPEAEEGIPATSVVTSRIQEPFVYRAY